MLPLLRTSSDYHLSSVHEEWRHNDRRAPTWGMRLPVDGRRLREHVIRANTNALLKYLTQIAPHFILFCTIDSRKFRLVVWQKHWLQRSVEAQVSRDTSRDKNSLISITSILVRIRSKGKKSEKWWAFWWPFPYQSKIISFNNHESRMQSVIEWMRTHLVQ